MVGADKGFEPLCTADIRAEQERQGQNTTKQDKAFIRAYRTS